MLFSTENELLTNLFAASIVYLYESRERGIGEMNDTIQLQPELFCMLDGTPIKTQEEWALRRTEILRILSEEEYGITPPPPASVT